VNQAQLFALLAEASALSGHQDFVVIGSLSILGLAQDMALPADMMVSIDVDCYTLHDPGRIFDLVAALGEGSPWHRRHGYYLDAVTPALPTLPDGWSGRLIMVARQGVRAWFLDPNDAALSKYARGEPRDQRWIRAGILHGAISLPITAARMRHTAFFDQQEERRAQAQIEADGAWLAGQSAGRSAGR
jgi:hypothetical protein